MILAEVTSNDGYLKMYPYFTYHVLTKGFVLLVLGCAFAAPAIVLSLVATRWSMIAASAFVVVADFLVFCEVFIQVSTIRYIRLAVRRYGTAVTKVETGRVYGNSSGAFALLAIGTYFIYQTSKFVGKDAVWEDAPLPNGPDDIEGGLDGDAKKVVGNVTL